MRFERGRVGQAPKRRGNSFRRRPGSDFWKDHERNTEFGKGVVLVGLELNSISGYSDITTVVVEHAQVPAQLPLGRGHGSGRGAGTDLLGQP
jgi:hypothetical protein